MNKHWHADWFQLFLSVISTVSVQSILDMAEYAIFIVAELIICFLLNSVCRNGLKYQV